MSTDYLAAIPAERRDAVNAALLQTFPKHYFNEIALLKGGLSGSAVYKLTTDNYTYTLKLNAPQASNTPIPDIATLAANAGVSPNVYYNNLVQGISISDFIENKPIRQVFAADALVTKLAQTIKAIHVIPFKSNTTNLFEVIDGLVDEFKSSNKLSGPVFDECFGYYEVLKNVYPLPDEDKVFSHNDLNPNNILCDGENIWVIDWDAAGLNNRYVDLANAANYFVHTPEQEQAYLYTYFGNDADEHQMACFYTMRQLTRIIYAMLMFRLAIKSQPVNFIHNPNMEGADMPTFGALMSAGKISLAQYEGQLMYGKVLLNTAVQQMRSARYAAAVKLL